MSGRESVFNGDMALTTPYGVVEIRNGGREIAFKLYDSISQSQHHKALFNYVRWLHDQGIERINCDHVSFAWLDRGINLKRGNRILDVAYYQKGRLVECELKTTREIWLETTAQQLREMERYCENLTLLVPRDQEEQTRHLMQTLKLYKTKVATYEC